MGLLVPTKHAGLAMCALAVLSAGALAVGVVTPPSAVPLVFLTRDGCVNTTTMRTRFDEALGRLGVATDYAVIDADTLSDSDARRGYGTPTVLYDGRDLFGMPEPTPPLPSPT